MKAESHSFIFGFLRQTILGLIMVFIVSTIGLFLAEFDEVKDILFEFNDLKAVVFSQLFFSEKIKEKNDIKSAVQETAESQEKITPTSPNTNASNIPNISNTQNIANTIISRKNTLNEMQEILDDIFEKTDIISQEIIDLLEENSEPDQKQEAVKPEAIIEEQGQIEEKDEGPRFFIKVKDEGAWQPETAQPETAKQGKKKKRKISKGGTPSPGPVFCGRDIETEPKRNEIIFNEIAWMGTDASANDEWIELKNISDSASNLSGWQILDKAQQIKIVFENTSIIPANGFFLLERTDDSTAPNISADFIYKGGLNNSNEELYLFNSNCHIQDRIIAEPNWPAGDNNEKRTMERGQDMSWHTYYGNRENGIMGTPKAENSQKIEFQPILEVEPEILEFNIIGFDSLSFSQTFNIYNVGGGILEWQADIEYVSSFDSPADWLNLEPISGFVTSNVSANIDISGLDIGQYLAKIVVTGEQGLQSPKEVNVFLNIEEEIIRDNVAPEVIFNVDSLQNSLSFPISFKLIDRTQEGASPSGLAGFTFRWKEEQGNWNEQEFQEISDALLDFSGEIEFNGQDEKTYYFQIKARDIFENESVWLTDSPAFAYIEIPKIIHINEIQVDGLQGSGGTDDDWVELYNPNDFEISLNNWSIQEHSADEPCSVDKGYYKKNFPNDAVIPANGFFLIVDTKANEDLKALADMTIGWSLINSNTIYLVKSKDKIENTDVSDIIDKVGFGKACFYEQAPAPEIPEAKSVERKELGLDTDNNSQDFVINKNPSPVNSKGRSLSSEQDNEESEENGNNENNGGNKSDKENENP